MKGISEKDIQEVSMPGGIPFVYKVRNVTQYYSSHQLLLIEIYSQQRYLYTSNLKTTLFLQFNSK